MDWFVRPGIARKKIIAQISKMAIDVLKMRALFMIAVKFGFLWNSLALSSYSFCMIPQYFIHLIIVVAWN
jgi:hypothetical protein